MSDHLPRHRLEQLIADASRPAAPARLRAHLGTCDQCDVRKRALEAARTQYLTEHPAAEFASAVVARAASAPPARVRTLKPPRVFVALAGIAAAAAIALIGVRMREAPPPPPAIRWKGQVSLQVFARHASATVELHGGEVLAAGDQLAFTYALEHPRYLLLLGIDEDGVITRYFPSDGDKAVALAAGRRAQLPVGIELDAQPGVERLYALFSETAPDESAARRALHDAFGQARARGVGVAELGELELPAGQVSVWFRKP
jgi:hypothetical protein